MRIYNHLHTWSDSSCCFMLWHIMLDLKHETLSELQPSHEVFEELSNVNKAIGVGLFTNLYQHDTNIYETPLKCLTKIYPRK